MVKMLKQSLEACIVGEIAEIKVAEFTESRIVDRLNESHIPGIIDTHSCDIITLSHLINDIAINLITRTWLNLSVAHPVSDVDLFIATYDETHKWSLTQNPEDKLMGYHILGTRGPAYRFDSPNIPPGYIMLMARDEDSRIAIFDCDTFSNKGIHCRWVLHPGRANGLLINMHEPKYTVLESLLTG